MLRCLNDNKKVGSQFVSKITTRNYSIRTIRFYSVFIQYLKFYWMTNILRDTHKIFSFFSRVGREDRAVICEKTNYYDLKSVKGI